MNSLDESITKPQAQQFLQRILKNQNTERVHVEFYSS